MSQKRQDAKEAHHYWQDQAISQLSTANNWLLATATGFLSFCISSYDIPDIRLTLCEMDCKLTLQVVSLWLSLFSILAGAIVLISRLFDFKLTRNVTAIKGKYKENDNDDFPKLTNETHNWRLKLCTFMRIILSTPKMDTEKSAEILLNKSDADYNKTFVELQNLRQDAHDLGGITWCVIKWQVGFLLAAVLCYVICILK